MKYIFLIVILLTAEVLLAQDSTVPQTPDTVAAPVAERPRPRRLIRPVADSIVRDSFPLIRPIVAVTLKKVDSSLLSDRAIYAANPFFTFTNPVRLGVSKKKWEGKETIFYAVMALLVIFALIRNGFPRYVQDLTKIYFRTTVKQKQIRDQLVESPMPSLLLNIFFLLSTGLFLALMLHYFKMGLQYDLWELFGYCAAGLVAVYGVKFLTLKLFGWIFQVTEAINSYVFIVFSTNKVMGMTLLPFVVILAFSNGVINEVAMNLSLLMIVGLLAYRFFLSYATIHRQVRISFFHFFLYLCAFELAPVLLINKLLFRLLGETS